MRPAPITPPREGAVTESKEVAISLAECGEQVMGLEV